MSTDHPTSYAPEHLEEIADRLSAADDGLNAVPLRQMAKAWQDTQTQLELTQAENSALQLRLNNVAAAVRAPTTN